MMKLIDYCRDHTVEQILALPDVEERVDLYRLHEPQFREQVLRCANVHRDLVVLDLRDQEIIFAVNRFMIYALFPECRVSMHVLWGVKQQNTVFAIGKSIIDRSSPLDVGAVGLGYGGGGHEARGNLPGRQRARRGDDGGIDREARFARALSHDRTGRLSTPYRATFSRQLGLFEGLWA